jgi:ElaB/YqjD/DUF883 family membrane-anchored ribosome-binding protein
MNNRSALDQARKDLAEVEAELSALLSTKSDASKTPAAFAKFRSNHEALAAERERLTTVIDNLEPIVAAEEASDTKEQLLRRYAEQKTSNAKLASRIQTDIRKANAILLSLIRDAAAAAAEDSEINAALPDDLEPLASADFIARSRPGLQRQELKTERVWLWVNERNGCLIGDQDSVVDSGNGFGRIGQGSYTVICRRALFTQTEYYPAVPAERPHAALWQLRLPQPDGPAFAFDGTRCNFPDAVLGELARAARITEPRERSIEIELKPVPAVEKEVAG